MRRRIVYTRPDGGVSICCPAKDAIRWMTLGGLWRDRSRGFVDGQIHRQIKEGRLEHAAVRFARAMVLGGLTTAEALEVIRDRDCGHLGTGHELWNAEDLPCDRWFRNAWRRSHNGGPIYVDLVKARRIQLSKVKNAVAAHNRPRLSLGRKPYVPMWGELGNAIRHARDEFELRRVWPAI